MKILCFLNVILLYLIFIISIYFPSPSMFLLLMDFRKRKKKKRWKEAQHVSNFQTVEVINKMASQIDIILEGLTIGVME